MILTPEQQALLDGAKGETMAKVVKTLVMYGDAFDAERMVPVTSEYGHTVISFGLKVLSPVYDLYQKLIDEGLLSQQKFTADPRPLDKKVPSSLLDDVVFKHIMYTDQKRYEQQLEDLGLLDEDSYTCTSYLPQVGNVPKQGDVLSWAESSAVIYANSVLGARCNRNSGIIELMGSVAGFVPEFGLLTDDGRKADWIVEVRCTERPEAQLLGSAIGMKVMEDVPYIRGLDRWLGTELNEAATTYPPISRISALPAPPTARSASTTSKTSRPRPNSRARRSCAKMRRSMSSTTRSCSASRTITPSSGKIRTPSRSSASSAVRT